MAFFLAVLYGSEGWQADRHVTSASVGEHWPKALALLDEDGFPRGHIHCLTLLAVMKDHPPLEHANPLVVVQCQPRFGRRCRDMDVRDAQLVVGRSYVAGVLVDLVRGSGA